MIRYKELKKWLGMTTFELVIMIISMAIFIVMLSLKLDGKLERLNWFTVHSPLYASDALVTYFSLIVFIRQYLEGHFRAAVFRFMWRIQQTFLLLLTKLLLCSKLEKHKLLSYSEVFAPMFFLLVLLVIRACQLR